MIPKKKRYQSIALTVFALLLVLALVQGAFAFKSQTVKVAVEGSSAPTVVSPTHLDSSIYYSNNDPTFIWSYSSDSEIQGYSYAFDQSDLFTEPDTSVVENVTEKTYSDVADGSWYLHVKAVDVNGTWSDTAHYMVKIDTTPPTGSVSINGGAESTDDANVSLNFDTSDLLSGVTSMRFAQSEEALQAEPYKDYSATDSANLGEVNGLKTIFAQFKDVAGNESAVVSDGIELALDQTPPSVPAITSSTHPDSSLYYNSNDPAFAFEATDEQSGIAGYGYVFDQLEGTVPEQAANDTTGALTLNDVADGTWYLHVRAVDGKGNWGEAAHYAVKIDTIAPQGSVMINGGAEATDNNVVNLTLSASDELSGVAGMRIAESEEALAGTGYKAYAESDTFTLSDVDGEKAVYAQFRDAAGNESAVSSDGITLAPTPYDQAKLSIGISGKWFNVGDTVQISGKLTDVSGAGLARYNVLIQVRGKIVATVRTQVGGGYSFEDQPVKTTPYKAIFIDKSGRKIITRAVVAHVKKAKKAKKVKAEKAKPGKKVDAGAKAGATKAVTGSSSSSVGKPLAGSGKTNASPSTGQASGSTNTPGNGHGKAKGLNKK